MKHQKIDWKVGDKCMAQYEVDGLLYEGKIISISGEKCVVLYDYYENEEEKLLKELKKLNASQCSIPELIKEKSDVNSNDFPPLQPSNTPSVEVLSEYLFFHTLNILLKNYFGAYLYIDYFYKHFPYK